MGYKVDVHYSPVQELLSSLNLYLNELWYCNSDLGPSWIQDVKNSLSVSFEDKLRNKKLAVWDPLVLLAKELPSETVSDFISSLEDLSDSEMNAILAPHLKKVPKDLRMLKSLCIELLSLWDMEYFSKTQVLHGVNLAQVATDLAQSLRDTDVSGYDFIGMTTHGLFIEPLERLEKVVLIPQYHCAPLNYYICFNEVTFCMYSAKPKKTESLNDLDHECIAALQAMSKAGGGIDFMGMRKLLKYDAMQTFKLMRKLSSHQAVRCHVYSERKFAYTLTEAAMTTIV